MEGLTGNSKNVPKKSTRLGFWQDTLQLRYKPKSLQPACTKFSNFVSILDMSIVTTPTFIISALQPAYIKFSNFMPILGTSVVSTPNFIISGNNLLCMSLR